MWWTDRWNSRYESWCSAVKRTYRCSNSTDRSHPHQVRYPHWRSGYGKLCLYSANSKIRTYWKPLGLCCSLLSPPAQKCLRLGLSGAIGILSLCSRDKESSEQLPSHAKVHNEDIIAVKIRATSMPPPKKAGSSPSYEFIRLLIPTFTIWKLHLL